MHVNRYSESAAFASGPRVTPRAFVLPDGDASQHSRERLLWQAFQILSRQHRTFVFMLSICGDGYARFARLDRSDCLISEQFNYIAHPEVIGTFLYRLSQMNAAQRGHDPSATLASGEEVERFSTLQSVYEGAPWMVRRLRHAMTEGWSICKLAVHSGDSLNEYPPQEYLVGRPAYMSPTVCGRGTKGFVALNLTENTAVFIKDSWRLRVSATRPERDIYEYLWEDPAPRMYVLTLLAGEDVGAPAFPQFTFTPEGPLSSRVHCRLVFKEICRDLNDFKGSRELVHIIHDALLGHRWAWEERKMLHRDVSVGNILIYDNPEKPDSPSKGLLCDWGLAKSAAEIKNPRASQASRPGTWQFMSALLSWYPQKDHLLSDDLESFMHVLTWCTMMYLPISATYSEEKLATTMSNYFDEYSGGHRGSSYKFESVLGAVVPSGDCRKTILSIY
ncbi:hypothetical protein C8Q78DRAFT_980990 [Trametes maxima]|nr:hypothetical protein C8Q78DRAFT_980990 [Trametes maxima]